MKKISFIAAGALALATLSGSAVAATANAAGVQKLVRVGISAEPYPPFTYKAPDGKWTGFEIDLRAAICHDAGLVCETAPTAWSGIIPALQIGKIDAIMNSMTITPQREKKISFTRPYYETGLEFITLASSGIKFPDGLKGKLLGVQGATQAADFARAKMAPLGVQLKIYDKQEQLSRDLEAGRVDGMVTDAVYARGFVKRHKGLTDTPIADWPMQHMAMGVRKNDTALRDALNKGINAVVKDGTCKKLAEQYLGFNVCPSH